MFRASLEMIKDLEEVKSQLSAQVEALSATIADQAPHVEMRFKYLSIISFFQNLSFNFVLKAGEGA
jgi:hypothetical protein